jgi:hypothetical protein
MKKKLLQTCFIILWLALLFCLGGYYLFFAPRDSEFTDTENRNLAAFPQITAESLFSGQFGQEIETYLLDRFPLRNAAISFANRFESLLSFASHEEYLLIAENVDDPLDAEFSDSDLEALLAELNAATEPPATEAPAPTEPAETIPEETEPVENPPIVPKPEVTMQDFPTMLGMYMDIGEGPVTLQSYHQSNVAAVTAVLNRYAELLPENGKLMFTVGPPSYLVNRFVNAETKVSFNNTWDEMITAIGADNVFAFDSCEILSGPIMEGEYMSFRTDNHWTPYGAYHIYSRMAAQAGKELCSYPDDFDITSEENFRGTYYRDNPSAYWGVEPDTLEHVMPKIGVEYRQITGKDEYTVIPFLKEDAIWNDRYTVYLGGPGGPWRYVECDNEETENCLVVTDSFGLTVIPYLTYNYKQVHYYDARYFNRYTVGYSVAEMIEKYQIHDIYVIVADFHSFNSGFVMSSVNGHLHG